MRKEGPSGLGNCNQTPCLMYIGNYCLVNTYCMPNSPIFTPILSPFYKETGAQSRSDSLRVTQSQCGLSWAGSPRGLAEGPV